MSQLLYHPPCAELKDFISVFYLFETSERIYHDHERASIAQARVIFEGSAVLNFANDHVEEADGGHVMGPTSGAYDFDLFGPFRMLGVGILPAGWAAMTRESAAGFTDRALPLKQLFPAIEPRLDELARCPDLPSMAKAVESVFLPLAKALDPAMLEFIRLVDEWLASDVSPRVSQLKERTGISDRHLTRRIRAIYGMPPKYLARKYRALRAARALAEPEQEADADFLRDAFYDQSHMIRELKRFAGITPAKVRTGEGELARKIDERKKLSGKIHDLTALT